MPIAIGLDLGTTTITAVALDTATGALIASCTAANQAETTNATDKAKGRCEWDAHQIAETASDCLRMVADQLPDRGRDTVGIGLTGQQHSVVLLDDRLRPLTPLINWQDRRAEERFPGTERTFVQQARQLVGESAPQRAGCNLAAGYMGVTLFWLKIAGALPSHAKACFLTDYVAAMLTGQSPATDPTFAASAGVFDVAAGRWAQDLIGALGLPIDVFPPVRQSGESLGQLTPAIAAQTGLPAGLPVCVGIGDNQASFLGSVGDPTDTVLVNVGTGGQVSAFTDRFVYHPSLETRPYPGGFLLVCAGLCGGRAYALLERFYRDVGATLFGITDSRPLFDHMNRLAAAVPQAADGLHCEPFFTGTRARPELRGVWSGFAP